MRDIPDNVLRLTDIMQLLHITFYFLKWNY